MIDKPVRLHRELIYASDWLNLYADRVRFPAGRIIDRHHILKFGTDSVAAIVTNGSGDILFVEAYRYSIDDVELELPMGRMEAGESAVQAAEREIMEETGYQTLGAELVYSYHPIIGISDTIFHVVRAEAGEPSGSFDTNEVRGTRWIPYEEVNKMVKNKKVRDGYTLTCLLLLFENVF